MSKTEQPTLDECFSLIGMTGKPVAIRKHAFLKRHYRRAVDSTVDFHKLDAGHQWALLRTEVEADSTAGRDTLLALFDSRVARRDEVLTALEEGRQTYAK